MLIPQRMVRYTLVNKTNESIDASLTVNGGGEGSTVFMHIPGGRSRDWNRNGSSQTFTIKFAGLKREFYNKNPGTYEFKKTSDGYRLF